MQSHVHLIYGDIMKKSVLISIIALGFSSAALASGARPIPVEPDYFSGVNLGVNLGVQHETGDYTGNLANETLITTEEPVDFLPGQFPSSLTTIVGARSMDMDIGQTAVAGGASLGYGKTFKSNYYLGIEGFGRYANSKSDVNVSDFVGTVTVTPFGTTVGPNEAFTTSLEVKSDWSYGGDIKLGYLINPKTMIYLLAGIDAREYDVNVTHSIANVSSSTLPANALMYSYSFDKTKVGFMPGVGIETMLTDKLSLVGQYTYSWFSSFDNSVVAGPVAITPPSFSTATLASEATDSVKMARGIYSLGLTYHFNGV